MGISSLGAGSSILTQDVLDQLRKADEASRITPIELNIANEEDKKVALEVIDASMTNFIDSINAISSSTLFDDRSVSLSGTSVEVTASSRSDVQEFTLEVTQLATKQIEESPALAFATETAFVGSGGQINLNIDGNDYAIDYTATTTLKELKDLINETAGESVDATLLNVGANDVRLVISSANTGTNQDITITDVTGTIDTNLSTGMLEISSALDAEFTFNGGTTITRSSNNITDLITGYDITLNELGSTSVGVAQDREAILEKMESFVNKYNNAMTELSKGTKISVESSERGIFSNESTIKSMQSTLRSMLDSVGGGVGTLFDYGFDMDKEGVLSLDKDILSDKLENEAGNTQAFFAGGDFTDPVDSSITTLEGSFLEISTIVEGYTKFNATLDLFKTSITDSISTYEDRKLSETEKLDSKYEIMKKQFTAYDLIISKFNSASSMFSQMITAQNAQNS